MGKILVTGATGKLGKKTVDHLLRRRSASDLIALARDPGKALDLSAQGVEVRKGDYSDYSSLLQAFAGVDKLLLISTHAFTNRENEHANVVRAAQEAGVRHVLYNPVIRKPGSTFKLMQVTEPDMFTIETLRGSGLDYTLLAQPPFIETLQFFVGADASSAGVRVPAGEGKVAPASRDDLAEAQAVVLTSSGHENKSYDLTGGPAISFADLARIVSQVHGKPVPYPQVSEAEYMEILVASGLPQIAAEFTLGWVRGINAGEWSVETGDLARLIGHSPMTTAEFLTRG